MSAPNLENIVAFTYTQVIAEPSTNLVHGYLLMEDPALVQRVTGKSQDSVQELVLQARVQLKREASDELLKRDEQLLHVPLLYAVHSSQIAIAAAGINPPNRYSIDFFERFDPNPRDVYVGENVFEGDSVAQDEICEHIEDLSLARERYDVGLIVLYEYEIGTQLFEFDDDAWVDDADATESYSAPHKSVAPKQIRSLIARGVGSPEIVEILTHQLFLARRAGNDELAQMHTDSIRNVAAGTLYQPCVEEIIKTVQHHRLGSKRALQRVLNAYLQQVHSYDRQDFKAVARHQAFIQRETHHFK
jgi:hypothetical protein